MSANLTDSPATDHIDGLTVHRLPLVKTKSLQIPSFMVTLAWHLLCNRRDFGIVHAHGTYRRAPSLPRYAIARQEVNTEDRHGQQRYRFPWPGTRLGKSQPVSRKALRPVHRYEPRRVPGVPVAGAQPSRVLLIPNGVDINRYRPVVSDDEKRCLKRELRLPDIPIVCFVGIIDARKNIDGILRVWQSTMRKGVVGTVSWSARSRRIATRSCRISARTVPALRR